MAIAPRNSNHPSNRRKNPTKYLLQRRWKPTDVMVGEPVVRAAENSIEQRNQRQKRNQHGRNIYRQTQAIRSAARNRAQEIIILMFGVFGHRDLSGRFGNFGFG